MPLTVTIEPGMITIGEHVFRCALRGQAASLIMTLNDVATLVELMARSDDPEVSTAAQERAALYRLAATEIETICESLETAIAITGEKDEPPPTETPAAPEASQ